MDRTALVPAHNGPLVLPNSPFFGKLLRHARRGRVAIRDVVLGVEKTYEHLLADALFLRAEIERTLSEDVRKQLQQQEEVFIGVLAAGGYEFAVAVVATLAIGAAVVPMCKRSFLPSWWHIANTKRRSGRSWHRGSRILRDEIKTSGDSFEFCCNFPGVNCNHIRKKETRQQPYKYHCSATSRAEQDFCARHGDFLGPPN
jgi:hypothetical protein